ncbi:MAG: BON domain-containing protein [Candidatus Sericytochromatia bacterium]|nr:BON domain-containing protein [Candidatus Tanganyikabacteria bacterium]
MIRLASWLSVISGGILLCQPAQAAGGAKAADAGYLMVQGRQVLLLTALPGQDLAARGLEIRRRLEAAVSKDGTVQPVGVVSLTDVAGTPVISVGKLPVASVTAWDATRAGQPAWALAHRWAASLEGSLATLRVGGPVPGSLVKLKTTGGDEVALAPPASAEPAAVAAVTPPGPIVISLKNGRITATIDGGVVTLAGQAATLAEKFEVAGRVAAVPGVVDVVNNVTVQAQRTVSDAEVASALSEAAR